MQVSHANLELRKDTSKNVLFAQNLEYGMISQQSYVEKLYWIFKELVGAVVVFQIQSHTVPALLSNHTDLSDTQ